MGNESTRFKGLDVDKSGKRDCDFWSMYFGEKKNDDGTTIYVTVFESTYFHSSKIFWEQHSPHERATNNIMIYRHPSILKYIASWKINHKQVLVTERCNAINIDSSVSDIQICLGLRSILRGLIFLNECAKARHLNVCASTIYVTQDDTWKLGGFEFVFKNEQVNSQLLEGIKTFRHTPAVDNNGQNQLNVVGIEQYSFAALCKDILQSRQGLSKDFLDYCVTHLQHDTVELRPKLSAILIHPYFTQDFILIHAFLTELPLKSSIEKQKFFTGLVDRLRLFDEATVAHHIGNFLLSRLVLLDQTAQLCVLPLILCPRIEDTSISLFSVSTFSKYIVPKLKNVFTVRHVQIRLILLEYFSSFVNCFPLEDLKQHILPNILVGIKDTNDILVSMTLRCLADLVPILGSTAVVGGNRQCFFSNSRPKCVPSSSFLFVEPRSITPILSNVYSESGVAENNDVSKSCHSAPKILPERLSPDGGEDVDTDEEAWSDWDIEDNSQKTNNHNCFSHQHINDDYVVNNSMKNDDLTNLNELGITDSLTDIVDDGDFFKDMEPSIDTSQPKLVLPDINGVEMCIDECRFKIKLNDVNEVGWDDGEDTF